MKKLVQGPYEKLKFVISMRVWLSSRKWCFFVKLCLVLVNEHSRLTTHCEFVNSSFTRLFPHLGLFLTQFLSVRFSESQQPKTGKSGKHKKIKRMQAGMMNTKLRISFKSLVKLK